MAKANLSRIWLFLILSALLVIISACNKEKSECKASSDCLQKACFTPKCTEGKCSQIVQRNCCGNGMQDELENGKPGNKCTCSHDYGKCEGKAKVQVMGRLQNTTYLYYFCNDQDECVFDVNDADIEIQNFPDTISIGYFKASALATYNKPLNVDKDSFQFKLSLDDLGKDIIPPISLTKIKLFYSTDLSRAEQQIAEQELDSDLTNIGDEVLIETPLNLGYRPRAVEETGTFRYSIDYTYTKRVATGREADGSIIYAEEPVRSTFNSLSKPVFMVKSE